LKEDLEKIDMIIVGTESGVDQSKASSVFIHGLLDIQPFVRAIEVKEACYGATAALDFAKNHVLNNPDSRVLVIASDIAKYGIKSSGESTQGAGSCAMLITSNPRILELNNDNVCLTRDVMDFWRPNYSHYAFVEAEEHGGNLYRVYYYSDAEKIPLECATLAAQLPQPSPTQRPTYQTKAVQRTFRIAIACTPQYTEYFWGKDGAFTQVVNTLNRVNAVYGQQLSVAFQLVSDKNIIVFS